MIPLLLGLVLLSDPRARAVDVSGGAVVQLQGGRAPRTPIDTPEPSVLVAVVPEVELLVRNRIRRGIFALRYTPRLMLRWPNLAGLRRPLVLHRVNALYSSALSQRWDVTGAASVSVGEIDYTAARFVFSDIQGALPRTEVTQYLMTTGTVTFTARVAPRHSLMITPDVTYSMPILEGGNVAADPMGNVSLALPRALTTTLFLSHGFRATQVDTVTTTAAGGYVDFDERGAQATGQAELEWGRRITPRLSSELAGGVFVAQSIRAPAMGVLAPSGGSPIMPTGRAGLVGRLYDRARLRLTGDLGIATQAFYDTIQGQVIPRAGGSIGLIAHVPPRWTAGVRGSLYTTATVEPRDFGGPDLEILALTETVITAQTPVSYRIDDHYSLEFGTMWSARGPHFRAPDFELRQLEIWGYIAFRFNFTTAQIERQRGSGGATVSGGQIQ